MIDSDLSWVPLSQLRFDGSIDSAADGTIALWVRSVQIDASRGEEITHSLARSLRRTLLRFAPLRSAPLRSAPLRAAPLAGSFVSEKVAMYERDHMRRYDTIQPIVRGFQSQAEKMKRRRKKWFDMTSRKNKIKARNVIIMKNPRSLSLQCTLG